MESRGVDPFEVREREGYFCARLGRLLGDGSERRADGEGRGAWRRGWEGS